ncbi:MAG TPA: hypothetical protein VEV38_13165 [Candidatus Eremiobacteraceae bacterium]|nr:hypothetical protein [Candidatus Eremiobacteraceae bacterium]
METRERSPNYPAFDLEEAIGMVEKVYAAAGRSSISYEATAIALGYGGLNGRSRSKIAALRHYGLVDDAGQSKIRISDRAVDLIHKAGDAPYMQAVRQAALTPPLFSELWAKYAAANDAILINHLVKDRKFSQDGAERVVKSYRETVGFAKLGEASDSGKVETDEIAGFTKPDTGGGTVPPVEHPKPPSQGGGFVSFNFMLSGGVNANIAFSPKPTPRSIDRLIEYLRLMRDDLQEEAQPPEAGQQEGAN